MFDLEANKAIALRLVEVFNGNQWRNAADNQVFEVHEP